MAIFTSSFFSKELMTNTEVNIILPIPGSSELLGLSDYKYPDENNKYQVLYLLHGVFGDYSNWLRYSNIERYAKENQLAVIMPSGGNSFYKNLNSGENYYNFYTKELPNIMESIYPISKQRENKFIAGLSMGGYGALKAGFRNPDKYGAIASLSGSLSIVEDYMNNEDTSGLESILINVFGLNNEYINLKEDSLYEIIENTKINDLPEIYIACGTEDGLYNSNIEFKKFLESKGIKIKYEEGEGDHNWIFWDKYIKRLMDWLPLKKGFVNK